MFCCPLLFFAPRSDLLTDPLAAQPRTPGVLAQLVPSLGTCEVQKNRWSSLKDVPYYHFAPTYRTPPYGTRPTCTPVALPKRPDLRSGARPPLPAHAPHSARRGRAAGERSQPPQCTHSARNATLRRRPKIAVSPSQNRHLDELSPWPPMLVLSRPRPPHRVPRTPGRGGPAAVPWWPPQLT